MAHKSNSPISQVNLPKARGAAWRAAASLGRPIVDVFRAVVGSRESLGLDIKARRMSMDFSARLSDALHKVSQPCLGSHGAPIFLLSAGWRSGSTLLQRMLMEFNDDIVIWGEPFDHSNIYDNMMNQFRCFTTSWPPQRRCFAQILIGAPELKVLPFQLLDPLTVGQRGVAVGIGCGLNARHP